MTTTDGRILPELFKPRLSQILRYACIDYLNCQPPTYTIKFKADPDRAVYYLSFRIPKKGYRTILLSKEDIWDQRADNIINKFCFKERYRK